MVVGLLALSTWDILRNSGGNSPIALRRAAFDGDEATVRRLIAAHPEWIDSVGSTNASKPAAGGLLEVTLIALGKPAPSPTSPEGEREEQFLKLEALGSTPLVHAVVGNHIDVARALLEAGAKVRVKDAHRFSVVPDSITRNNPTFLSALRVGGTMLSPKDAGFGPWLLHAAVQEGEAKLVQFFIERGIPLNGTNSAGGTPLWLAINFHRLDLVQLLVTNGVDFVCVPVRRQSAVEVARAIAADEPSSNATAIVSWLEAFAATNQPPAKPAP